MLRKRLIAIILNLTFMLAVFQEAIIAETIPHPTGPVPIGPECESIIKMVKSGEISKNFLSILDACGTDFAPYSKDGGNTFIYQPNTKKKVPCKVSLDGKNDVITVENSEPLTYGFTNTFSELYQLQKDKDGDIIYTPPLFNMGLSINSTVDAYDHVPPIFPEMNSDYIKNIKFTENQIIYTQEIYIPLDGNSCVFQIIKEEFGLETVPVTVNFVINYKADYDWVEIDLARFMHPSYNDNDSSIISASYPIVVDNYTDKPFFVSCSNAVKKNKAWFHFLTGLRMWLFKDIKVRTDLIPRTNSLKKIAKITGNTVPKFGYISTYPGLITQKEQQEDPEWLTKVFHTMLNLLANIAPQYLCHFPSASSLYQNSELLQKYNLNADGMYSQTNIGGIGIWSLILVLSMHALRVFAVGVVAAGIVLWTLDIINPPNPPNPPNPDPPQNSCPSTFGGPIALGILGDGALSDIFFNMFKPDYENNGEEFNFGAKIGTAEYLLSLKREKRKKKPDNKCKIPQRLTKVNGEMESADTDYTWYLKIDKRPDADNSTIGDDDDQKKVRLILLQDNKAFEDNSDTTGNDDDWIDTYGMPLRFIAFYEDDSNSN